MNGLEILLPVVLLLSAGFFVIFVSRLLRISPIIGFLLVGVIGGPNVLGVIPENNITSLLAKLGVVFLLFDIGLHFSFKSMWSRRQDLLGLGPLQVLLSSIALGAGVGFLFNMSIDLAVLVGLSLALSSTAVVMQLLADLKQSESPVGQSGKSVLIFQDIVAIFLLIYADAMSGTDALSIIIGDAVAKTILAVAAAIALGRFILTPLLKSMTRYDDPEMFTILSLLIVMITALATEQAGLSLTLGAFLAGMVLAETPFRILLQTELRPFRSLLIALFFVTVGLMLDPFMIFQNADVVLSVMALVVAVKLLVIGGLLLYFKRPLHHTAQLTFLLAQGSEFAFVVFSMAAVESALGTIISQELIAGVALSMLLTPFLMIFANRWSLNICRALETSISNCPEGANNPLEKRPVFIVGMNDVGKTLARGLRAHNIPYIAIDSDRDRFLQSTASGYVVAYGKTSDLRFWNQLGVSQASAICLADPNYKIAKELTPIIKKLYPTLNRYVAVNEPSNALRFAELGLIPFHNHGTPPGLSMISHILMDLDIGQQEVQTWAMEEHYAYVESNKSKPVNNQASLIAAE